jgi:GT2 family glycosyltransferase
MKKINTDISVVLPIHKLDDTTKLLFSKAVESVAQQLVVPDALVIVAPKGSQEVTYLKSFEFSENIKDKVIIVENDGETDFASQVNLGVEKCKTTWFSILEFDDQFSEIWFKNVVEYKTAHPEVGLFMPIIIDVDKNDSFIGFTNEAVWASSFSDELGILDLQALLVSPNFNTDGMVMRKELFVEFGGFKPNIKLTFIYEFLLRMTFKDVRVMVIPRWGYKHLNQRDGSLFAEYKETLNPVEAKWWESQAKKEYYFQANRKITYDSTTA